NDQIKTVAAEFARAGYLALAVDLYDGRVAETRDGARSLMQAVVPGEATDTLASWIAWLRGHAKANGKIGTIGWCFGGGWSLNASIAAPVDATVVYYGRVTKTPAELAALEGPVLGHFATRDKWINGEMVAGFAHEVNQPLYSIGNFAKACENHIEQDATVDTEKLSQWLAEISACARRSKEILARLKGFARQSVPQRKSLRIDQAIDESIKMLEFELRDRNVAVDYELAEGIEVRADDVQVQQVFANLIRNACEAFDESGTEDPRLTIRTTQRHGFCEVRVADNGPGMDGEQIERAFQSFSTTKSAGLGLGLAISRTIVEGHGGKIAIVPNRHRGITCHFTLPLARGDE
ncbi:MAG: dienelactone hydrolase family protein, partial [Planctomycetes bacterium]|nr:dienelactone hydrolase family protein [Planctomycetota bacterium]